MANILNLDPQVQIRIIDLAWEWARSKPIVTSTSWEVISKIIDERFAQSFKAILKTFLPEQTGAPRTKKSLSL
ncbi:unnamed protein product [marine sediment metagenome]|uniref:Uncharacterized protein n=1 Tax=marine sediment metagenome TaxID=412755 RepID=X1SPD1_9ZZZZ